jgi:predicted ribosomally synthesized peptide with SipW-like signal peptide
MKKKSIATLLIVVVLTAAIAVGGTLAYLTAKTDTVTNTFTVGKVALTLTETKQSDGTARGTTPWSAKLIPGTTYAKNPVVTVTNDSEDCYLFVKFEENNNPATYLTYTSQLTADNGWTQGDGKDIPANVWYRTVLKNATTKTWQLLAGGTNTNTDGQVTVKDNVGSTAVPMPATNDAPTLVYTAYAVQLDNLTAAQAWTEANN